MKIQPVMTIDQKVRAAEVREGTRRCSENRTKSGHPKQIGHPGSSILVRIETWKPTKLVRLYTWKETKMTVQEAIGNTESRNQIVDQAYRIRKARKLLSLNWEPNSVARYLERDGPLDKRHAQTIVRNVRFGV